jgi:quinol monooxygenase YgiN
MTVEYIRYIIEPSRADAFVAAYTNAAVSLRESPHCQGYELTRCTEAAESYVLRIVWDSEQGHLQGFRKSPQFKTFLAAIQPFVRDIEEMRHYEPTALHWSRSG